MKKKFIIFGLCTVLLTNCGVNSESDSSSGVKEETSVINVTSENVVSSMSENDTSEDTFIELYGAKFCYPNSFEENRVSGLTGMYIFSGNISNDDIVHFFVAINPFYEEDFDVTSVPDILGDLSMKFVDNKFPTYNSKYSMSTDSEASVELSGYTFIKRVGNIHTESDEQTSELKYCAYYGKLDLPKYEYYNVPVMWMTFTDSNSEEALSEIETIADYTANLLYWE